MGNGKPLYFLLEISYMSMEINMKILQINVFYKSGSTGKIVYDIHSELKKHRIDSVVCYGRGQNTEDDNVYKVSGNFYCRTQALKGRITGLMYGGSFLSTNKLFRIIEKENPDVVHLHCLNGNFVNIYRLITYLRQNKIKAVLTLHAEFMHTANCSHALECDNWKNGCERCVEFKTQTKSWFFDRANVSWLKMKKAFDGFGKIQIVSVSPWLMNRAIQSPILADKKHSVVLNGVDTSVFTPCGFDSIKSKYPTDNKIIFFATANFDPTTDDIKGGKYILQLAEKLKDEKIIIVVAALDGVATALPENVVYISRTKTQNELAQYYSMADVSLIVSQRETFCMPVAESLCCGTPVIGFKAGAPEQIALAQYSEFVDYGDVEALKKCVLKWINKKQDREIDPISLAKIAESTYSKEKMVESYIELYKI